MAAEAAVGVTAEGVAAEAAVGVAVEVVEVAEVAVVAEVAEVAEVDWQQADGRGWATPRNLG